jgi:hypothetical protein
MSDAFSNALKTSEISCWDDFLSCLPSNWREIAFNCNVLKGQRKDKDPETLMRLFMLHLLCGYSLRETSAIASAADIADLSDVAILKRLRKSDEMFSQLCSELFCKVSNNYELTDYNVRLFDGTIIKEPGQFGTQWRIHFSYSVPSMSCDDFKITQATGVGTGEVLEQLEVNTNDIIIADRGYCRFSAFNYLAQNRAYGCIRWNSGALRLYNDDESAFDVKSFLKKLHKEGMCGESAVYIHGKTPEEKILCRICAIRKNPAAASQARRKLLLEAKKKKATPTDLALFACDFVIIITTLPAENFTLKKILELYRIRWQVELAFKRFKSIAKIGSLPKYTESSARAWIHGKMFIALMIEKLSSRLGAFSPWREIEYGGCEKEFIQRVQSFVSYFSTMDNPSN